jgi:predicted ester cyclase
MSTTNTDMARRLIAAFDAADESAVEELIHPQHRDHGPDEEGLGREAVRESMRWVIATFGDRDTEIEDLFATDDRVVARVRFAATQIGELPTGLTPTHRRFEPSTSTSGASPTDSSPSTGCSGTTSAR